MTVFIKRVDISGATPVKVSISPNKKIACPTLIRKTDTTMSMQEEKYPSLHLFMDKHFSPHYDIIEEPSGIRLVLKLFDTDNVPEAFTIENGTVSVTRTFAITKMSQRIEEILMETNHKNMIIETLSRYINTVIEPRNLAAIRQNVTILLRESLQVRHCAIKRTIIDLINSVKE